MKSKEVTLKIFEKYLDLIDYKLVEIQRVEKDPVLKTMYNLVDNLGRPTGIIVNDEYIKLDANGIQINFFFDSCWIETIYDDSISLTEKKDNAGIFINLLKQKT